MSTTDDTEQRLGDPRDTVARQHGVEKPPPAEVDPSELVRFSDDLPEELAPDRRRELAERADALHPWLQGPFLLGGDLVVGGAWRTDLCWLALGEHVPDDLSKTTVLDIGSNAGYDPFMFNLRGAKRILACEPFEFHDQALFLQDLYGTSIDFQRIGWQDLDPATHGTFDLVHCHGVVYHEPNPMLLLQKLRAMLAEGGTLLFGSMMLADPELSEYARFVPGRYFGDPTWWWVPGRLSMRWMLETAGFEVEAEFGEHDGPPGQFPVINGYFKASGAEPSSLITG
jgi:SAM-dependent methyltransferase